MIEKMKTADEILQILEQLCVDGVNMATTDCQNAQNKDLHFYFKGEASGYRVILAEIQNLKKQQKD